MTASGDGFWSIDHWSDAEENAARWLRAWGYGDARTTMRGADGGLDVVGTGVAAQVKFEAKLTGRPAVQNLVGAATVLPGEEDLFFFSNAGFSAGAVEFAEGRVALFTYGSNGWPTPVNAQARGIMMANPGVPHGIVVTNPGVQSGQAFGPTSVVKEKESAPLVPGAFAPLWLVLALLFTYSFVRGIFNPVNYAHPPLKVVGLFVLFIAIPAFFWGMFRLSRRARRQFEEQLNRGASDVHSPDADSRELIPEQAASSSDRIRDGDDESQTQVGGTR